MRNKNKKRDCSVFWTFSTYNRHVFDCVFGCVIYRTLSPESLAVVALGGLCRGRGCVEQQHRKRVKVPRANWNQMSEATGRGILTVEQERQRGKFASP